MNEAGAAAALAAAKAKGRPASMPSPCLSNAMACRPLLVVRHTTSITYAHPHLILPCTNQMVPDQAMIRSLLVEM